MFAEKRTRFYGFLSFDCRWLNQIDRFSIELYRRRLSNRWTWRGNEILLFTVRSSNIFCRIDMDAGKIRFRCWWNRRRTWWELITRFVEQRAKKILLFSRKINKFSIRLVLLSSKNFKTKSIDKRPERRHTRFVLEVKKTRIPKSYISCCIKSISFWSNAILDLTRLSLE